MSIKYFEKERVFKLDTINTSYVISIIDNENFIGHSYFGRKLENDIIANNPSYLTRINEFPFTPSVNARDRMSFMDCFPFEYPGHGVGDYREGCIRVKTEEGHSAVSLSYVDYKIIEGKPELISSAGKLPSTFSESKNVQTLEIKAIDSVLHLEVLLRYSVFDDNDAIIRSTVVKNNSSKPIYLTKVFSACLDMDNQDFEMITLHGSWARERHIQRKKIGFGKQGVYSMRGETGHQDHPFIALVTPNTTQTCGEVYAMNFVYSGNFALQADVNQFNYVRTTIGINPEDFCWKLNQDDTFVSPEAVLVYSSEGLGQMTRTFHDLYRNHLIRGSYKDKKRPILINNWEATYFNFDTEKLLAIAKEASTRGIEMLVMDDGWFGNRSSDNMALGDWFVNEEKLNGGLKYLVDEVNKLGLKFGIWFEPEMISPDSDLYRTHPDYAISVPNRTPGLARNQLVLDFSRKEVVDTVWQMMVKVLKSANIEYVKWDMNRPLADIGGIMLAKDQQGELYHRYVLGVYELQERLITEFPNLLLENCSGGGARFDPAMLYFSPQIWCSDDADAIERLSIQEGTALVYPLSTMGAHVSVCPNHTVGRNTPFTTRGHVALAGTFGYELDITKLSDQDKEEIKAQTQMYHKYNDLVRTGDYYRLYSYSENNQFDMWMIVSKDKKEALATFVQVLNRPNYHSRKVLLQGLDKDKNYSISFEGSNSQDDMKFYQGKVISGNILMKAGLLVLNPWGDFQSKLIHIKEI